MFLGAFFAAAGVSVAFMPLWYADRGLSAAAIGAIMGTASGLRVLAVPAWGALSDRSATRRAPLVTAAAIAAAGAALFVPAHGYTPILLVAVLHGVAATALSPLTDALSLALAAAGRLDYGRVRALGSASYMAATAAAGPLVGAMGARIVPWLLAGGYGLAALLGTRLPEPEMAAGSRARLAGALGLLARPQFRLALASSALIQGSHAAYYGFAPLLWRAAGLSDTAIGLLIAEGIVAEIGLFLWGGRLADRLGPPWLTGIAAAASILRWSVTAFATALPALAAVQLLHAATFALQHLSAMRLLARFVPAERAATGQTLHTALGTSGPTGILLAVAGALYGMIGGKVFLLMAVLSGSALLLVPALARATRGGR